MRKSTHVPRAISVAPEGCVGLMCNTCGMWVSSRRWQDILRAQTIITGSTNVNCENCTSKIYLESTAAHGLDSRDVSLYQMDELPSERLWFHVTTRSDWFAPHNLFEQDFPLVHLGSLKSIIDRAVILSMTAYPQPLYVYTVKVSPLTTVGDAVLEDAYSTVDWISAVDDNNETLEMNGAYYMNRVESPGSISLIVKTAALTIVNREKFDSADISMTALCQNPYVMGLA